MPRLRRIDEDGLRPQNDPPYLVLVSLAGGPRHGYALIQDIEAFSGVRLKAATLYGAITRLEAEGLIEALEPEGRRRPYRISESGISSLRRSSDDLGRIVAEAVIRLSILGEGDEDRVEVKVR